MPLTIRIFKGTKLIYSYSYLATVPYLQFNVYLRLLRLLLLLLLLIIIIIIINSNSYFT
jgi:hypothetical protein